MLAEIGFFKLLPTIVILIVALTIRRTFESLVAGSIVGFIIINPANAFSNISSTILKVMSNDTIGWIIMVCGLFGSLIYLLVKSGGAMEFAKFLLKYVKGRRSALLITWLLGLVIFIDDYLNALTVGSSMKRITDKFKVPREMLAYIVDSTAAPVCVIIPLSTWAVYVGGLLESLEIVPPGQGLNGYIGAIPYIMYGWVAALIVPLVILKIIPALGAMKKAEKRVIETGVLAPPNSQTISMSNVQKAEIEKPSMWFFILPILVLIAATLLFEIDVFKGILTALGFTIIYFIIKKIYNLKEMIEGIFEGFKSMLLPLAIIIWSFVIKEMNDQLELTQYVVESIKPIISRALFPTIIFLSLSVVTFATGSFWGVYAISFPIVLPLAQVMDVNISLAVGAVISAGAFGSHACFYGDTTVLSSSSSGCNNMSHIATQLPYTLIAAGIAAIIYLILGFTM